MESIILAYKFNILIYLQVLYVMLTHEIICYRIQCLHIC